MSKVNAASEISQLQNNWIKRLSIQYKPLSDDIFKQKQPPRLAELLLSIDYHATHNRSYNDDIGINVGYGESLDYGIITVNKKVDQDSLEVKSYVAVTVVGQGDDAKVLLMTADDQDRLDMYMGSNKVDADSEDFKSSEVLIVLKDIQKEHGIADKDIYYVNYTLPDLEARASTFQTNESRQYLRYNMQQIGGRNPKWNDVVYDNANYLAEKLSQSPVTGIAYSKSELKEIKEIANNLSGIEVADNKDFEHDGHTFDTESGVNKIVFNRLLIKSLKEKSKKQTDIIQKHLPQVGKNENVRITCGDHKSSQRVFWKDPETVLDELHKAGLEHLTLDDITETIEITKKEHDLPAIKKVLEDMGLDYKDMKNTGFSIMSGTNTKVFKEKFKEGIEEDIEAINEAIDSKMDMYEPGDEEINEVESAHDAGYGVNPS
jgi:hypothetical protein